MDRRFMFMRKILTPGGCLPLNPGAIYDHNFQTYARQVKAKFYREHG